MEVVEVLPEPAGIDCHRKEASCGNGALWGQAQRAQGQAGRDSPMNYQLHVCSTKSPTVSGWKVNKFETRGEGSWGKGPQPFMGPSACIGRTSAPTFKFAVGFSQGDLSFLVDVPSPRNQGCLVLDELRTAG